MSVISEKDIIEGNSLIAEFIGMRQGRIEDKRWPADWFDDKGVINGHRNEILLFHSSYDWLIPVLDKITDLDEYTSYKDDHSSLLSDGSISINTKFIISTWEEIVDFIKWYNTIKK